MNKDSRVFQSYLEEIKRYPKLDRQAEVEIALKIQAGDEDALLRIVEANLRYVVLIAKKYTGSGIPYSELINEGAIGLIEAGKRFKPEKGVKFITYAVWWVRQAILIAIANRAAIVKLPPRSANLLYLINKRIQYLSQILGREPQISELSTDLNVPEKDIEILLRVTRVSIPVDSNQSDNDEVNPVVTLPDQNTPLADDQVIEDDFVDDVELLLTCLDDREQEILKLHYGFNGQTLSLQQIGHKFNLTRERIRQIEQRAIRKLKRVAMHRKLHDYLK
jgi:RNA polymerase primary sigma factor